MLTLNAPEMLLLLSSNISKVWLKDKQKATVLLKTDVLTLNAPEKI